MTVPHPTVAVMDLTMISTAEVTNVNHFTISCINGERGSVRVELDIKKDNKILMLPKEPSFKVHKPRNKEATATDFHDVEHIGIFYCKSKNTVPPETVTMINNFEKCTFRQLFLRHFIYVVTPKWLSILLCPGFGWYTIFTCVTLLFCMFQQFLFQLTWLLRLTKERQSTLLWSCSAQKRETWPGNTTVNRLMPSYTERKWTVQITHP